MSVPIALTTAGPPRARTVTDQLFETLYRQVLTLDLPPGSRLSEVEVAKHLGVSRQPVRDAFWRLSRIGFLEIRPQRSTTVTRISERAVAQARFLRTALEAETVRVAATCLGPADFAALDALLDEQAQAIEVGDRMRFHALDDDFHQMICDRAGLDFAWAQIRESKAHMDRVRFLSLAFGALSAIEDHRAILAALKAGDAAAGVAAMRTHLGRIGDIVARIRLTHPTHFDAAEQGRG